MKVSELTRAALNWAVAKCAGLISGNDFDIGFINESGFDPSEDWAQGGPIIEREGMALNMEDTREWRVSMWWDDEDSKGDILMVGPTPLIAAMRCYVASQMGDEIELPEELK
jgi:hypothetical protein